MMQGIISGRVGWLREGEEEYRFAVCFATDVNEYPSFLVQARWGFH